MTMFTWGTDPEFMIMQDGHLVSAIGIVAQDRKQKHNYNGHLFYYDNVLAEIAVRPASTRAEAVHYISTTINVLSQIVWPATLLCRASAEYPSSCLRHKDARRVGCKDENCAYTMDIVEKPTHIILKTGFRSAGGHIHIGSKIPALQQQWQKSIAVKMMDLFVGLPSVLIDHDPSTAARRRIYGQAGRHRNKDYGIEYRTLSNFWLARPALTELIYDLTDFVVGFLEEGRHLTLWTHDTSRIKSGNCAEAYQCDTYDWQGVINAINNSDKSAARTLMQFVERYLPKKLYDRVYEESTPKTHEPFYQAWSIK